MKEALPVAVIGAGHMGRHHVRKYAEMDSAKLIAVVDANLERARELAEPLGVKYATELTADLGDVAAVSIAVPTVDHLPIAKPLIERGVAVRGPGVGEGSGRPMTEKDAESTGVVCKKGHRLMEQFLSGEID